MARFIKKNIFNTELNADSVEWCPIESFRHFFCCGTYQLSKTENSKDINERNPMELRRGHLYLFQLMQWPNELKIVDKIAVVGILDCKWAHRLIFNNIYLAVATSLGEIQIYKLHDAEAASLKYVFSHKVHSSSSTLALSLDWSTGLTDQNVKIVVSDSEGCVTLLSFTDGQICEISKWKLHTFQAWIVAFNYWNTNVFYSGGDDCNLLIYDQRSGKVEKNNRAHSAGITSMHTNLKNEHSFITGSYDENVAFWDVRQMKRPKELLSTGGGVWRLKWEPYECNYIAAACMHNGFTAVDATNYSILAEYKEHSSLAYGIDWSYLQQKEISEYFNIEVSSQKELHLLAMCSFYDNFLSLSILQKGK